MILVIMPPEDEMSLGPTCPNCGKPVSLGRTQWNLGKTFQCARCDTSLVVPKSNAAIWGAGAFLTFWLFRQHFPQEWGGQFALFALIVLLILPLSWAATKVRLANVR